MSSRLKKAPAPINTDQNQQGGIGIWSCYQEKTLFRKETQKWAGSFHGTVPGANKTGGFNSKVDFRIIN